MVRGTQLWHCYSNKICTFEFVLELVHRYMVYFGKIYLVTSLAFVFLSCMGELRNM